MNPLIKLTQKPLTAAMAGMLAIALPAALALPATSAMAQASQQADLDRAVRALRSITTLKADFTQTDRNGQVLRGELTLKKPGRIRFEYSADVNMLVVSNGSALTFVDYDVQQVQRVPLSDSPLGPLLNPNNDLRRYGRLLQTNNPNVVSIEVSDPTKPENAAITLIFVRNSAAPGGLQLASWVALDSQNIRTTVRLSNHRYGMAVSESTFRFRDPRNSSRRPG